MSKLLFNLIVLNAWFYKDLRSWALVISITALNITLQLGPLYFYIGWSELDRTLV